MATSSRRRRGPVSFTSTMATANAPAQAEHTYTNEHKHAHNRTHIHANTCVLSALLAKKRLALPVEGSTCDAMLRRPRSSTKHHQRPNQFSRQAKHTFKVQNYPKNVLT